MSEKKDFDVITRRLDSNETIEGTITGQVRKIQESDYGYKLFVKNVSVDSVKTGDCVVYANQSCDIGDVIEVDGTLQSFASRKNEGEFDLKMYYRSIGYNYKVKAKNIKIVRKNSNFIYALAQATREKMEHNLYKIADKKSASVFAAMLLGSKDEMDKDVYRLFSTCGIGHILAISGLHISLIGMGLYKLLRRLRANYVVAMIGGSAFIVFYGIMTGNGISATRAIIMFEVAVYANVVRRTYDILTATSLASLIMLFQNPLLIHNSGFVLSYGAIVGIAVVGQNLIDAFNVKSKLLRGLITSISLQLVTMPITMYVYYQVPVLSVVLNLIVVPLMTYVMSFAIAGTLLTYISDFLGMIVIWPAILLIRLYELLCTVNLKIPWAVINCGKPEYWQLLLYYLVLFFAVVLCRRFNSKISFAIVIPFILLFVRFNYGFRVDFIYVGQGDGIFITTPKGKHILVDCGSSDNLGLYEYTIEPFLLSKGVDRIDAVYISHCDNDHISGILDILQSDNIKIDTIFLPKIGFFDENYNKMEELGAKAGTKVSYVYSGLKMELDAVSLTCIHPSYDYVCADRNDYSTSLIVEYKDFNMLLTGDISSEIEEGLCGDIAKYAPFDVIKAAHHGSRYSNSEALLNAARPKNMVISCGIANSYGHPHKETLDRLTKVVPECNVSRTDEAGEISVFYKKGAVKIVDMN